MLETERLILPLNYPKISEPVLFLAGPVQGAPNWQEEAIEYLYSKNPEIWVASPRRRNMKGFVYHQQVAWERHWLRKVSQNGLVLFWFADEAEVIPGRAYAKTSRFEFGEAKINYEYGVSNLSIGIEPGFSGRYFRQVLKDECRGLIIHRTLKRTLDDALKQMNQL